MAVVVVKSPQKRYQMVGGIGLSQRDREQADRLDILLETRISELVQDLKQKGLMPSERGRGSLRAYWELGRILRAIYDGPDFPYKAELPLLWINAKLYVPEELLYQERGPYREHLWYCFRLGGYPESTAKRMNWSEWVTIFDSSGINQEPRFDAWFQQKLYRQRSRLDRDWVRMFAQCVNEMLGNIDILELADTELQNCFESAWQIATIWHVKKKANPSCSVGRKEIQSAISDSLGMLDQIMEGQVAPKEYAEYIIETAPK